MLVCAVPLKKLLIGYIGKHNHGTEETYLHFLHIVYKIARRPTVINTLVIVVFRNTMCFSCSTNISSQSGGSVGSQNVNCFSNSPFPSGAGSVNAFTLLFELPDGLTNLYSSITAELSIMLSIMRTLNMHIITSVSIASNPSIADMNSKMHHLSAYCMNLLKSFCAFWNAFSS